MALTAKSPDGGPKGDEPARRAPAVSVIVPCFNGGRFLDALMASLERQTFRDFEIVVIDDGSTEPATLSKLAALEKSARIVHQENGGPSSARNRGVHAARGDILFMLDCDDTIEPGFLAETLSALQAAPPGIGMVFADLRLVGAETGLVSRYFNRFDLLFTNTMASGLVLHRSAFDAAGGYDETMREGYEDWDFSLRLARAGYRGLRVPQPLYVYYIGSDDTHPSRSAGVDKRMLYGKLWRAIRERHPESFRLRAMVQFWRQSRDGTGRVPLWKGLAAYLAAIILPDAVFSQLIKRLHRGARADASSEPYGSTAGQVRVAP